MATLSASVPSVPARARSRGALWSLAVPFASATALLGVALLMVLTPWAVHLALESGGGGMALGMPAEVTYRLSDETVHDLVFGGDFEVRAPGGGPIYSPAEVGHLGNARLVLGVFLAFAAACAAFVLMALVRAADRASTWRAVGRGGAGLAIAVLTLGIVGLVAFGPAFELFHRIFFFGGNWAFDWTSPLVRLYPEGFWVAASAMLGGFALGLGLFTWAASRIRTAPR